MTEVERNVDANRPLRSGWTTGACATAAAKSAYARILAGSFLDPVTIALPRGGSAAFALAQEWYRDGRATAGVVKDAGDDPDITHGATILATVRTTHEGVTFCAGEGVGTVTRAGLPLAVGEPAINPVPRAMITAALGEVAAAAGVPVAAEVTLSIPGGAALAAKTWNPRLGIVGGLSVLGTTGIVTPYSCAAWIHSIHRGVDVARAAGLAHIAAATGSTSERAAQAALGLPDMAMIDMGDFAGGLLKYLARHPVARLTIAGGFGKLTKLAAGAMDLHSSRSQVDHARLAAWMREAGGTEADAVAVAAAPTAMAALDLARRRQVDLAGQVARRAGEAARERLAGASVGVDVMIVDRAGHIVAHG
ncbi:cobalt-precorrin-5B (C(1))-methyltransferase [Acuticoccus sp. I52.16.1]|uniref:cobalt-precorrin-5B (C(1))-methyltransferase n=1 Tax=Acuticoccus sp. I52.16.1 TaxID=2928472 RepID=UPI001FD2F39C|nr:cobalt-precorrin-5B (C(1))-methyltransferase [Acuticoccus sp. I52.16.1]UOM33563.1 cobalt-precorrin-5B (C(1))-methyltransferase [Acuticoccus sp. I52.16.1]